MCHMFNLFKNFKNIRIEIVLMMMLVNCSSEKILGNSKIFSSNILLMKNLSQLVYNNVELDYVRYQIMLYCYKICRHV